MATFERVRIEANAKDFPVLLSNGNLLEEGDCGDGERKYAIWQDPFPKVICWCSIDVKLM